jgi:hypothetical protein
MATNKQFDELVSKWLEESAPSRLPERVLDATFERTRKSRQPTGWRAFLARLRFLRFAPPLGSAAVIVLAAAVAINYYANQPGLGGAPVLPSSPESWSRASIDTRFQTAQIDRFTASPRGLLALVGELGSGAFELAVSSNGEEWSQVSDDDHPPLEGHNVVLAGTSEGFLMVVDNDVWASSDGLIWEGLASPVEEPALRRGEIVAVSAGGPGFVAVGRNNMAWYSANGSDWSLAEVPPATEIFGRENLTETVFMQGVAVAGDRLVAWGEARGENGLEEIVVPVIWTSIDGLSWANSPDLQMDAITAVAGGPNGFVAIGADFSENSDAPYAAWFSVDGQTWQQGDAFTSLDDEGTASMSVKSVAATQAGFVAVGANGECALTPCRPEDSPLDAAIWTSADGLSWSRLPRNELFNAENPSDPGPAGESDATSVARWGSRFVVGGQFDTRPVVWLSGPNRAGDDAQPTPTMAPPGAEATVPLASPSRQPFGFHESFEPGAGRIFCGTRDGATGPVLGCSTDGARVLIQKGEENLFILHADGSETQVTDQLSGFSEMLGSSRPAGATISPDGSRVVFAGLTMVGLSCHNGALFAVDADGGPAGLLWESQAAPDGGIVRYPAFSPDGTQIAFVDGYCDHNHSVWVMNADGSNAHKIVSDEIGPLDATHVHGLAWSQTGDRIAITVDQGSYTFATDGSHFTADGDVSEFCWPGWRC